MKAVIALLSIALVTAGCTPEDDDVAQVPTAPGTATAVPADPAPAPAPEPTTPAEPFDDDDEAFPSAAQMRDMDFADLCELAGRGWCDDANGNRWPDVVESRAGLDPAAPTCQEESCDGLGVEELLVQVQANTLLVLDASGSMAGAAGGGQTKMDAAKQALVRYVQATPEFADLGLLVYGHRGDNTDAGRPESCAGVESFADIGSLTRESVDGVVAGFQATGWTPIAGALDAAGPILQAAADADAAEGVEGVPSRVIVISDGIETCDGDPVASAQALQGLGIEVVVDVVGFDIGDGDRDALREVAEVTGGAYYDAQDGRALNDVLAAYTRQAQEAVGPIQCQRLALSRLAQCGSTLSRDMGEAMRQLADEVLADDPARAAFINSWFVVLSEQARELVQTDVDELQATLDTFLAQLEEAERLAEEAFAGRAGQKVSAVRVDCPWV